MSGYFQLIHPKSPDPLPAFRFLEGLDSGEYRNHYMQEHFLRPGSRGAFSLYLFITRMAQMLKRQGHAQEALRSLDISKTHLPDLFNEHYVENMKPTDPATFRRLPTAAESRRGVPLDKDGYVLDDEGIDRLRRDGRAYY